MKTYYLTLILSLWFSFAAYSQGISFNINTVDDNFVGPAGIFLSDINNDNHLDIVCAGMESNTIAWWKNSGSNPIEWEKQIIDNNFDEAIYTSAGDIDGDGNIDILGAAYSDHELAWWKNNGEETINWTKYVIKESFTKAHEILPIDLDLDGDMDILGVSAGLHTIIWFENDGNTNWTEHIIVEGFVGARSVDAKDIDGDGDIDLAGAALTDNEIAWWRNDGGTPIQFTKITLSTNFNSAHKVQIVDIDKDGNQDILGTAYGSGIKWWQNPGTETGEWQQNHVAYYNTAVIGWAFDADNDGDNDIAGSAEGTSRLRIWENNGEQPIIWTKLQIDNLAGAWPLNYGDIDNDGDIDMVCGGNSANEIRWYENETIQNETVSDFDGNIYHTINIDNRTWLKENLKSLHYSDGTEITEVWAYDDNETNADVYGRLYSWDAAMNYSSAEGAQGACPDGWHIPSDVEWTELGTFLGGDNVAGGKLKESGTEHWLSPNTGATNESGFTALPAGEYDDTHYQLLNEFAVFWSSTETSTTKCKYRYLSYEDAELHTYNYYKDFRYSVRCLKNTFVGFEDYGSVEKKIWISPNPAIESINIDIPSSEKTSAVISIYNINGSLIKWKKISSLRNKIDVSDLKVGMYFISVQIGDEIITEKFIKK
jgi:uncharacterized protein (TIGR02145 family)